MLMSRFSFLAPGHFRAWIPIMVLAVNAGGQVPTFQPGEVSVLSCRVITKLGPEATNMLVVDVTNRGRSSAEPLSFDVTIDVPPDPSGRFRNHRFHRAGRRTWGRAGRAIKPGRTQRYWLPGLWGEATPLDKTRVSVTRASFFRGRGIDKAPVEVVKLEDFETLDDFTKLQVKMTRAVVKNTVAHPVHVFLRATPRGGGAPLLVHAHLEARETKTIGEPLQPGGDWSDRLPSIPVMSGRYEQVDVLDWSVLVDESHGDAVALAEAAWSERYRWPVSESTGVEGSVSFELGLHRDRSRAEGEARFVLPAGGPGRVETEVPLSDDLRYALLRSVGAALEELRRPAFDAIAEQAEIELLDRGEDGAVTVLLRSRRKDHSVIPLPVLHIENARIVAAEQEQLGLHREASFTNGELPDGRYAAFAREIRLVNFPVGTTTLERSQWRLEDRQGFVVPAEARRESFDMLSGEPECSATLRFGEVTLIGPREKAAPQGDGVDLLRIAWSKPYRYPTEARDLQGTLTIEAPNSADNWSANTEIEGLLGIRGFRGGARSENRWSYDDLEFRPRGKISAAGSAQIADLLSARLTIWSRQDFAARPRFAEAFRGCTIRRMKEEGLLEVEGHDRIAMVRVEGGLPLEIHDRDGTRHLRRFATVKAHLVPVEARWIYSDRVALLQTRFEPLATGFLFPTRIEISEWFFPGWGPETYTMKLRIPPRSKRNR